ncbi:exopolysaccharide biosynthesis polyprenyl glycosylphosphotransferase [Bosea minatitlanensis]|uniref:Exopolysaccharide biosynthesis polyprenyl glycosylphosphotransferase n=1 Tax=Bosea minatitlanensis TaxID=128782 RepID=A0ABW0F832_9HYPH|nr:exopolysaccharide biosynthesis polyprenyl glycosylphosphotransferase [Bosea minatitlanensis]MCT4495638.1 exopolysaccharide biosynthesis polyprenyl glycosylphosphotransferase [Bosea minatitlanensis]
MSTNAISPRMRHLSMAVLAHGTQLFWTVLVAALEMIVIVACAYGAFVAYSAVVYGVIFFRLDYALASLAVGALYVALCIADNQYDLLGPQWNEHCCSRGGVALGLSFVTLLTIGYLTNSLGGYSRGTFLAQLLATLFGQIAIRAGLAHVIERVRWRGRWRRESMVVLVMPGARGVGHVRARLAARHEHILRWYDFPAAPGGGGGASLEAQLAAIRSECRVLPIDAVLVLFGSDNMEDVSKAVGALSELPVRIQLLPVELAELMRRSRIGSYGHLRVLELFCGPCSLRDRFLKRTFDIAGSVVLLTLLWPLFLVVAALIKLDTRGPVLFRQMRLGFNNEPIQVLKFRSMNCLEEARAGFRQATRGDPRVTRVGRVLRRTNIDELPQLLNVLRGEMSLVGPRPHAVAHNQMFADQIRRMFRRHNVKPGMTGWAQVNGLRGETDTFEKMQKRIEHDLYYVDNWSFFFDLRILVRTIVSRSARINAY